MDTTVNIGEARDTLSSLTAQGMTRRFSPAMREYPDESPPQGLSGISFYEIAQLIRRGRIPVSMARAGALDWDHGDPFDRLVVATAMEGGLDLLTKDRMIAAYCPRAAGQASGAVFRMTAG